ncbi:linear amide C-N hydrolase [Legionella oakridgensis]|uniref:linear amide C-N hydrolase n=1 Tax=Legionella oakridgensis TaxID=29423 RepID=UPI0003DDF68C|nr:choloylglycine hydrolase family protein [Legionella oakridgensis]ETO92433.1 penicillin V acylase [Legionella oakridgensis RV-2-2007]
MNKKNRISACIIFIGSLVTGTLFACTGLQLKAKDDSYVNGRTVEFGVPLQLSGLIVPRQYEFKGTLPDGSNTGLPYRSKYAAIGANTFKMPAIMDGINERGLSAGMFYFPGYASYATITPENQKRALAPTEFVNWVLTQFATVDEVKQAVKSVVIAPTGQPEWGGVPPFHYIVYDKSGKSLVIEPLKGELVVFDDPIGIITNSPTFDWHLTNLSNYINLSPLNAPTATVDGYQVQQFGQGSGLRGMPGDFTPPSRFIRATIFSSTAVPAQNAQEAVFDVFHILNQFDIPVGAVRAESDGKTTSEYTLATTVKDPQNLKYYYRTYADQAIKSIDLKAFDLNNQHLMTIGFSGKQTVIDVSKSAHLMLSTP